MAEKTVNPEDEYFARLSLEQQAKLAEQVAAEKAAKEREELRLVHTQRCGKCGGPLEPQPFRGVEIDVCQWDGSVLLDQGELEQLAGTDSSGVLSGLAALFSPRRRA